MTRQVRQLELRCTACSWRELCGPNLVAGWLRRAGKLRAGRQPEPDILYEVLCATVGQLACPKCGKVGLAVGPPGEDLTEWPGPRRCQSCSKPIPKARREAMPHATRCADCQRDSELGRPTEQTQHCPRCGAPLEVRVSRSGGSTRYVLACSANPPCSL